MSKLFIPGQHKPFNVRGGQTTRKPVPGSRIAKQLTTKIMRNAWLLIVDDDISFLNAIKEKLSREGWKQIDTASDETEATDKLKTHRYDYVVLDSVLSKRNKEDTTGGIKLLKSLITNPDSPTNFGTPALLWSSQQSTEAERGLTIFDAAKLKEESVQIRKKEELCDAAELSHLIIDGISSKKT
ncbi:MAG: response regulator [Candidatus Margulisiibacteriota bacterium]